MLTTLLGSVTALGLLAAYVWTMVGIVRGDEAPEDTPDQPSVSGFAP